MDYTAFIQNVTCVSQTQNCTLMVIVQAPRTSDEHFEGKSSLTNMATIKCQDI